MNVIAIPPQELEGHGMCGEDGLRDVDTPKPVLVPQEVVFTEVRVDQIAVFVQFAQHFQRLFPRFRQILFTQIRLFQSRRRFGNQIN